jgi:flagella basal body P-ring formation protein FlgA
LAGRPLPSGRLARAIRAGDALSSADIAETGVQLRGDIVTVQYRVGALVLESSGELSQNAHVGESVRVRLRGSGDSLVGRLASARLVEVGDQP